MEDNNTGTIHRVATAFQSNYYNPHTALHNTSYFNTLSLGISNGIYTIYDIVGNSITHIDAFSRAIIGTLQAGLIQARSNVTDTFTATTTALGNASATTLSVAANTITIGGQSLQDLITSTVTTILNSQFLNLASGHLVSPLAEIDNLKTNLISPLATGGNVTVAGKLVVKPANQATDSAAIALEVHGSASISGTLASGSITTDSIQINTDATVAGKLTTETLSTNEASVAGTLAVNNIRGNQVSISGNLSVNEVHANFGIFEQGITSMGPITSNIITATDQLAVGTSFTISNNAINTIGTDLEIQSLRQGAISFEGGLIRMDTDGNMSVNGNLNLLGEIDAVHGVFSGTLTAHALATDLISPVADSNISVGFTDSKFNIHNSKTGTGSAVLTIDNQGNVKSSGSATFGRLNFNLVGKAEATSLSEAVATGSAGFATLRQGQPELTIKNNLITSKSLIYITPFGDTDNKVLYLLRQVPNIDQDGVPTPSGGSFTVGISGSPTRAPAWRPWAPPARSPRRGPWPLFSPCRTFSRRRD